MRRLVLLAVVLASATPATAQGFNPFGSTQTTTGAYMTPPSRPAPRYLPPPSRPMPYGAYRQQPLLEDDEDIPQPRRRRAASAPLPSLSSDGGPRPAIGAATPARVPFFSSYGAGNIVIDSGGRSLYFVLSATEAYRYPVAVGREGFAWTGVESVSRKAEWPDWRPPAEMRQRQPGLPEVMTGGLRNPLGARAIYLGSTLYRIHGTNDTRSIGGAASSGCFRMSNAHVVDLYNRVSNGATVHVVARLPATVSRGVAQNDVGPAASLPQRRRPPAL